MAKGQIKMKKTPEVLSLIYEGASLDCTIKEICNLANISTDTYHRWVREDEVLSCEIKRLRDNPILKARKTVINGLNEDKNAQWYLERKRKKEFSTRTEVNSTVSNVVAFNLVIPTADQLETSEPIDITPDIQSDNDEDVTSEVDNIEE